MGQQIFRGAMPAGPAPGSDDTRAFLFGSKIVDCCGGRRKIFVVVDENAKMTDAPYMTRARVSGCGPCVFIHVCLLKYVVMERHSIQYLEGVGDLEI